MTFAAPLGLIALAALPVILALHLIGARRRRMVVPSLMLWRDVPIRRQGERLRTLPITLLLLLHLLAAGLVGLALARPQLSGLPVEGARDTAVLIDTTTSMAARESGRSRLDLARDRAKAIVAGLRPGDRVSLIALGPQPRLVASGSSADAALLTGALDQLQAAGVGADLGGALAMAEASLDPQLRRSVVLISDGALGDQEPRTLSVPYSFVQVGSALPNRAVVTFAARPSGGKLQVYARVANYGGPPFPTTMRLYSGETLLSTDVVPLPADGEYELTWSLPASVGDLRAALDGGDALPEDDRAFLSVRAARPVQTLLVSSSPERLQRALQSVPGVKLTTIAPDAYTPSQSAAADLTVLEGFVPPAWPESATLVVGPPAGSPLLSVGADARPVSSDSLVRRGALLDGLSFSGVRFGDVATLAAPAWAAPILSVRDQSLSDAGDVTSGERPLVLRGRAEGREVAVWTFDLARGNLPVRLAFPLLVARTVRDLTATQPPAAVPAGGTFALRPDPRADSLELTAPDGTSAPLSVGEAGAIPGLTIPGLYRIAERQGARTLYSATVAVSAGSPSESRIQPGDPPPITGADSDPGGGALIPQPVDLWPWLVAAALAVLAFEWIFVLRR